eukprot:gene15149-9275_t
MHTKIAAVVLLACTAGLVTGDACDESGVAVDHDYCIIGAGPGGLQLGQLMLNAGRNYAIFERNSVPGSFYTEYPRHRTLISLNKRNTG